MGVNSVIHQVLTEVNSSTVLNVADTDSSEHKSHGTSSSRQQADIPTVKKLKQDEKMAARPPLSS